MSKAPTRAKQAQHAEQKMRDARDRETQHRTPGKGEPRFRDGADREGLGRDGWSEVGDADEAQGT